jgi:anti-anti-sigma factor
MPDAFHDAFAMSVSGEIDLANAADLDARLRRWSAAGDGDVVVDCSAMSFIDSSGLSVLMRHGLALLRRQRRLVLLNVSKACCRTIAIYGVSDVVLLRSTTKARAGRSS